MKLSVIGQGYLGLTHAVAMAKLGHQVIGIEQDPKKLSMLRSGQVPFHEPGLADAMSEVLAAGRLAFQAAHDEKTRDCEVHFLCVGTPQLSGSNAADTSFVFRAAEELASVIRPEAVLAGKSTVPVGTAMEIKTRMSEIAGFDVSVAWNPEFLREGTALEDSLRPDRIVVGSWDQKSVERLKAVYQPMIASGTPFLVLDVPTAELVKVAANAFLATKISFINAMAEIAERTGADTVSLAEAIGYDERIGKKFLRSGIGFGGGCLPKDIRGFIARAEELGVGSAVEFLKDVDQINLRRRQRVVEIAQEQLGDLRDKNILILGISFKPDSDDLRDSPSLAIAKLLKEKGANPVVHDPISLPALAGMGLGIRGEQDLASASKEADLVILGTEWKDYIQLDPKVLSDVANKLVIDGRNALDVKKWQESGWKVIALGRNIQN